MRAALLTTTQDLSRVYPNSSRRSPSQESLFRAAYFICVTSLHLRKTLDLNTKLPLVRQHWTDQHYKNKNTTAICFPLMTFRIFCAVRVVEVSCRSSKRDPGNLLRMVRSIFTNHKRSDCTIFVFILTENTHFF